MQVQVNLGIDQLLEIVKKLPEKDIVKIRHELDKRKPESTDRQAFEKFLLNGPVFSQKQLDTIAKTRKSINKWREK